MTHSYYERQRVGRRELEEDSENAQISSDTIN